MLAAVKDLPAFAALWFRFSNEFVAGQKDSTHISISLSQRRAPELLPADSVRELLYFINDGHKYAKNKRIYLSARFIGDEPLTPGYYYFGADGKMVVD